MTELFPQSSAPSSSNQTSQHTNTNLQTCSMIWLDATVHSQDNLTAQHRLRSAVSHLTTFDRIDQCQTFVQSSPVKSRIIFVVSGDYCQQIIPEVHHLLQIFSIYIFCADRDLHQSWSQQYDKVKGIHNQLDQLLDQMKSDRARRVLNRSDDPLPLLLLNAKGIGEQSTTGLDGRFVQSQLLISCLLKMQTASTDREEFVTHFREICQQSAKYAKDIEQFDKAYRSEDCLWWYTKDTFVYRQLNEALRQQDIDPLFLFQFFIRDIGQELDQGQWKNQIKLYRGQMMRKEELEVLQSSIGTLISFNSFLSTSRNREVAYMYAGADSNNGTLEKVIIEIDADPTEVGAKPFADVSHTSDFYDEEEILMMLGSIFRLTHIDFDKHEGIWEIKLQLCSDDDCEVKNVVHHMGKQYGLIDTKLLWLAYILIDMSNFEDAKNYLCRVLKELPPDHRDVPRCYQALGKVYCELGEYQQAHIDLNKALQSLRQFQSHSSRLAYIYNNIGEVYQNEKKWPQALHSYQKALKLFRETFTEDDECIAWCYNNMGIIYERQNNYQKAEEYLSKALRIKKKVLPPKHPCLGNTYNNLGNVHYQLKQYDQALENYQLCYQTFEKSVKSGHPSMARILRNIGIVYEMNNDLVQAKEKYEKAFATRRSTLSASHPDMIESKEDITRISSKILEVDI